MSDISVRAILRKSKNALKEAFLRKRLNWECISEPLKEDPRELLRIHDPTIEDYRMMTKSADGTTKAAYDWWYSAVVQDSTKRLYFVILAFHPNWSFYRIASIDMDRSSNSNSRGLPAVPVIAGDFHSRINYEEHGDAIEMWVAKTELPSEKSLMRCAIGLGTSQLALQTKNTTMDVTFASLGPVFWINRGREATCSPRGGKMHGFYDISHVEGFITQKGSRTAISGVGASEHLISFAPLEDFWKRIDGIFMCTDQIYCTFVYLANEIDSKRYEYKDGAVIFRASKEYLIPVDFKIEYLEFDSSKKVPIKIRVVAQTRKGELDIVSQAIAETERQLALRLVDGRFSFSNGEKLQLTNGYGQHALH